MSRLERLAHPQPGRDARLFCARRGHSTPSLAHWERKMLGPKPALDYEDPAEPVVRTLGLTVR